MLFRSHKTLGERACIDFRHVVEDYDRVRDLIAKTLPGFEDMNRRVRGKHGFVLPNTARERTWKTETGKAQFTVTELPKIELDDGELLLMTLRSHDQYNTTLYGMDDRYRGIYGRRDVLLMHPDDLAAHGLSAGERVDVTSVFLGETRSMKGFFAALPFELPRRCAAAYFPEANPLVHRDSVADESNTPTSKSVIIRVSRSEKESQPG